MRSVILTQPELSFEQYLTYDDGTDNCYELVCGVLEQMPLPRGLHARICRYLFRLLDGEVTKLNLTWQVYTDVIGVRTGIKSARIPDLVIITDEQEQEILNKAAIVETAPILAIEVVSPNDSQRDYQAKKNEYERIGIPEYWIVDPIEGQVSVLILIDQKYQEQIYLIDQSITSVIFPSLVVSVRQILQME